MRAGSTKKSRKAKLAAAEAFFKKYGVLPLDEKTVERIEAEWRGAAERLDGRFRRTGARP